MQDNHCPFCSSLLHVLSSAVVEPAKKGPNGVAIGKAFDELMGAVIADDAAVMECKLLALKRELMGGK